VGRKCWGKEAGCRLGSSCSNSWTYDSL